MKAQASASVGICLARRYLRTELSRPVTVFAVLALAYCFALQVSEAQLTILHSFGDGSVPDDGSYPFAGLTLAPNGKFYGATGFQVAHPPGNSGTVFELTSGGTVKILYRFPEAAHTSPQSQLLYYKRKLLGTSSTNNNGSIFATTLSGKTTTWDTFNGTDGQWPYASLILGSDRDLYGTTGSGGADNRGTIFKISPVAPYTLTVIYSFSSSGKGGVFPGWALLLAQDGNYYGTTGGDAVRGKGGTIFRMTPAGKVTFVYKFPNSNDIPSSPLIQDSEGNFYGASGQIIFKMTPQSVVTTLHTFGQGTDGSYPTGVVLGPTGNLYGSTTSGGTASYGTLFELSTDGSSFNILHNFSDGSVPNDGQQPYGIPAVGPDNNLYGTTAYGGSAGFGTIYSFSP